MREVPIDYAKATTLSVRAETIDLLERIRARIPGVAIRTTMMVGFPGETEEDFQQLVEFVKDFRFDALGVFPYSTEPDTPAGGMAGQLPEDVRQARTDELMLAQQAVAFEQTAGKVGHTFDVLIDGAAPDGTCCGRHQGQAPEVDAATYISDCDLEPGTIVEATCIASRQYDLVARTGS